MLTPGDNVLVSESKRQSIFTGILRQVNQSPVASRQSPVASRQYKILIFEVWVPSTIRAFRPFFVKIFLLTSIPALNFWRLVTGDWRLLAFPAARTSRVSLQGHFAELHGLGIEKQQASGQGAADSGNEFDRLHGLQCADDADQWCHDTAFGTAELQVVPVLVEALITGIVAVAGIKHADLPFHAYGGARNQGNLVFHRGGIDGKAR
jgi:hypothetical protein